MIEKMSSAIAKTICDNMNEEIAESKYEIIRYGIECAINTLIPIIFYIVYAVIYKSLPQMFVWLATFLMYRNLIGGYHAASHLKCIFFSTIYGLFALYTIHLVSGVLLRYKITAFIVFFIIHIFFKPIIHHEENRNQTYIKKTRGQIFLTLLVTFTLSIFFSRLVPSISSAILIGVTSAELLFLIALPRFLHDYDN